MTEYEPTEAELFDDMTEDEANFIMEVLTEHYDIPAPNENETDEEYFARLETEADKAAWYDQDR